jgi:hypothetical protein
MKKSFQVPVHPPHGNYRADFTFHPNQLGFIRVRPARVLQIRDSKHGRAAHLAHPARKHAS